MVGFKVVLFFTVVLYMTSHGDFLERAVGDLLPIPKDNRQLAVDMLRDSIEGVFFLPCKIACLHGVVTLCSFSVLGIDFPFFAAFLAVVLSIVPIVPSYVVCWPWALVLILHHDWTGVLLIASQYLILSFIDNELCSQSLREANPYLTGLSTFLGFAVFGVQGVLLGPLIICLGTLIHASMGFLESSTSKAAATSFEGLTPAMRSTTPAPVSGALGQWGEDKVKDKDGLRKRQFARSKKLLCRLESVGSIPPDKGGPERGGAEGTTVGIDSGSEPGVVDSSDLVGTLSPVQRQLDGLQQQCWKSPPKQRNEERSEGLINSSGGILSEGEGDRQRPQKRRAQSERFTRTQRPEALGGEEGHRGLWFVSKSPNFWYVLLSKFLHVLLSQFLYVLLSKCLYVLLSKCLYVLLSKCLYALLSKCLYVLLSKCLYALLSKYLYVLLSKCLYVLLSKCLYALLSKCLYVLLSKCLYVLLSKCLYVLLSKCCHVLRSCNAPKYSEA
ncbi:unnamed protein product [Discosporangium mesarthrocarpum]